MATIFGIQIGSKFPSTKKYEAWLDKTQADYERFTAFENSELLRRYRELDALIHSGEFEKKVRELKALRYKDTPQWHQLNQYKALRSSSDIKSYFKYLKSGKLERMRQIEASSSYKEYIELKNYINSTEFIAAKAHKDFKTSDAYAKFRTFKTLSKQADIKFYNSTASKQEYKTVIKLEDSERLKGFFELENTIKSQEFQDHKAFMEDRKRFEKSEEARLINEFKLLQKNEEIKWFFEKEKKNPFTDIKKWKLTFEENFDAISLDTGRWMTGYYWGKALINENYVPANEKQFFTERNIELRESMARITTRQEEARGKVWDLTMGFIPHQFNYTSGLISTGRSFRQKYGKFMAKVRFSATYPAVSAFWMAGEKITPHIDIVKTAYKKGDNIECGVYMNEGKELAKRTHKVNGATFKNEFYIYTCEWSPEAIIWKINGHEVARETKHIPNEAMYLSFCTILPEEPAAGTLPATMEIDWVRCYEAVQA